jgi:hypothetical protein
MDALEGGPCSQSLREDPRVGSIAIERKTQQSDQWAIGSTQWSVQLATNRPMVIRRTLVVSNMAPLGRLESLIVAID